MNKNNKLNNDLSNGCNRDLDKDTGRSLNREKKIKNGLIFSLYGLILGAVAGGLVWLVLKVMNLGIEFLWDYLPEKIDGGLLYTLTVCLTGGLLIGLFQTKFGVLPDSLETVMGKLKADGTYPYNNIHVVACAALMPLIFGGSLGPEAGLTGMIVGLCCWAGDRLKYKGEQARELAEAGMAATLGLIFNAPFYGFANNYEHRRSENRKYFIAKEFRLLKTIVYICAIAGGFAGMMGLGHIFGDGGGLPRFSYEDVPTWSDWKYFAVFAAAGTLAGILYILVEKVTGKLAGYAEKRRVISCMTAGIAVALLGTAIPETMFSGEHQLSYLMEDWTDITAGLLVAIAACKIVLTNICIAFGWRGGNIFPVIYSGTALGYALAAFTGVNPVFAVAATVSALCGAVMGKPVTAVAVLFLCMPIRFVVPMLVAAYIGSLAASAYRKDK